MSNPTEPTPITAGAVVEFVRAAQLPGNARSTIAVGRRARVFAVEGDRVRFLLLGDRANRAGLVQASYLRAVAE